MTAVLRRLPNNPIVRPSDIRFTRASGAFNPGVCVDRASGRVVLLVTDGGQLIATRFIKGGWIIRNRTVRSLSLAATTRQCKYRPASAMAATDASTANDNVLRCESDEKRVAPIPLMAQRSRCPVTGRRRSS